MPKYALISDIHGNLPALTAVLSEIKNTGIADILCLGDIVGYGADPAACIQLVMDRCSAAVMGNHDEMTSSQKGYSAMPHVTGGIDLAKRQLTSDQMNWLRGLPYHGIIEDFTISHASLYRPFEFNYLFHNDDFRGHFFYQKTPVSFSGHTHIPIMAEQDGPLVRLTILGNAPKPIAGGSKVAFNVGSVGQPRDGRPEAAFGIFDSAKLVFELRRVKYDIAKARQRISEEKLPRTNAERLEHGE